jgi:hypothetical protein
MAFNIVNVPGDKLLENAGYAHNKAGVTVDVAKDESQAIEVRPKSTPAAPMGGGDNSKHTQINIAGPQTIKG